MTGMKRFWDKVALEESGGGFAILLDSRPVKTPERKPLLLPGKPLAEAVLAEWHDVEEKVVPAAMPMTGFANAAIDRVAADRDAFVDSIAAFGESDFFCYRADSPKELASRQATAWGKWTDWAEQRLGGPLVTVQGITHKSQPKETLAQMKAAVDALSAFQLAAGSKITYLSGSLIAFLALAEGAADAESLWSDLTLEESWQEEQWGTDDFARKNREDRKREFEQAARFLALAGE